MKYALVIPDGCADESQESLGGLTPLQAARTPAMDRIASSGVVGLANFVPAHLPAGSEVANMSLLGYDPIVYFTGRAPLEAAAQGIELGPHDWAIRCNLVTIIDQIMMDFTAGHISTAEATQLLRTAQERMGAERLQFVPGVSYRNLLICRGAPELALFSDDTRTTPPHDLTDRSVAEYYPRGPGSDLLSQIMSDSLEWFADHPVNTSRTQRAQPPATNVWLWGQGRRPRLAPFQEVYGLQGAMITAVDLLRGLALLIGWRCIDVPGATGYIDTDYGAKGRHAVQALGGTDLVCVHIEAPDEASHSGDCAAKIEALERIDAEIVAPLYDVIRSSPAGRILISPDHPTPLRTKTHSHGPVPLALCGTGIFPDAQQAYHERAAAASGLRFDEGWKLMKFFLGSPESPAADTAK